MPDRDRILQKQRGAEGTILNFYANISAHMMLDAFY